MHPRRGGMTTPADFTVINYAETVTENSTLAPFGAVTVITAVPAFIGISIPSCVTLQTSAFEFTNEIRSGSPSQVYGICCSLPIFATIDFTAQVNVAVAKPAIAALSAAVAASTSVCVAYALA